MFSGRVCFPSPLSWFSKALSLPDPRTFLLYYCFLHPLPLPCGSFPTSFLFFLPSFLLLPFFQLLLLPLFASALSGFVFPPPSPPLPPFFLPCFPVCVSHLPFLSFFHFPLLLFFLCLSTLSHPTLDVFLCPYLYPVFFPSPHFLPPHFSTSSSSTLETSQRLPAGAAPCAWYRQRMRGGAGWVCVSGGPGPGRRPLVTSSVDEGPTPALGACPATVETGYGHGPERWTLGTDPGPPLTNCKMQ